MTCNTIPLNDTDNYLYSSDIAFVAYLLVEQQEYVSIDKPPRSSRATFVFKRNPELNKLEKDYLSDRARVSPTAFFNTIKTLKAKVYNL